MLHALDLHNLLVSWWFCRTHPSLAFAGNSVKKRNHQRRMVWWKARVTHVATILTEVSGPKTFSEWSARPPSFYCNIRLEVSDFSVDNMKAHIHCALYQQSGLLLVLWKCGGLLWAQFCLPWHQISIVLDTTTSNRVVGPSSDGHFQQDDMTRRMSSISSNLTVSSLCTHTTASSH